MNHTRIFTRLWQSFRCNDLRERGMSLVELIIYIILVAIIGGLITGLLINVFRVNGEVTTTSQSSNEAQLLMDRIEIAVRNASAVKVESDGASALLITQTRSTESGSVNANVFRCVGIYFDSTSGKIHYVSDPLDTPRSKSASGSPSAAAAWPVFLDDVETASGNPVFDYTGTGVAAHYAFNPPRISKPVEMRSFIDTRSLGDNSGKCF